MTTTADACLNRSDVETTSALRGTLRFGGVVGLGSLFAALLSGCCMDSTCGCEGGDVSTSTNTVVVPNDDVLAIVGEIAEGPIDADACGQLCSSLYAGRVLSCKDVGPAPGSGSTGTAGAGGVGGTGSGTGGLGGGGFGAGGDGGFGAGGDGGFGGGGGFGAGGDGVGGGGGFGGGGFGGGGLGGDGGVGGASENDGGFGGQPATNDGARQIECVVETTFYCEGRRHAAVEADRTGRGPSPVAAWLARAAEAEAASVPAFLALRDELRRFDAPEDLVRDARRAAGDEVRHADAMRQLARARGAASRAHHDRVEAPIRSLFDLALENAVEGCVYETFSGLVAMHQARHAEDATIREAMRTIAGDEIRHGELAWRIHAWACGRLSADEIAAIEAAVRRAADEMVDALGGESLDHEAREALGLPSPAAARALARGVRAELWS